MQLFRKRELFLWIKVFSFISLRISYLWWRYIFIEWYYGVFVHFSFCLGKKKTFCLPLQKPPKSCTNIILFFHLGFAKLGFWTKVEETVYYLMAKNVRGSQELLSKCGRREEN